MGGGKQQAGFGIDMAVEIGQRSMVIQADIPKRLGAKDKEIVINDAEIVRVGAEEQIDHLAVPQAAAGQQGQTKLRDVRIFLQ